MAMEHGLNDQLLCVIHCRETKDGMLPVVPHDSLICNELQTLFVDSAQDVIVRVRSVEAVLRERLSHYPTVSDMLSSSIRLLRSMDASYQKKNSYS